MNRRGPRRSRRRARAAGLGISLYELEQYAVGRGGADAEDPVVPHARSAESSEQLRCCTATVTRRVALGGTVMVTSVHEAHCGVWGAAVS
ncbi:hypothetical protein GCM10009759_67430 [Kitasatospora saccharophila]|uniref:Uncharacterized protein n=1 Tax=Kitasatospora saccharophila TaxID=407973 RepID=A0ABN2Y2P6_9ACTN